MKKLSAILLSLALAVSVFGVSTSASAYHYGRGYYKWVSTPCGCKKVFYKPVCYRPVCCRPPVERPCCGCGFF